MKVIKFDNFTNYFLPAGEKKKINQEDIDNATNLKRNTLEEFETKVFSVWQVKLFHGLIWKNGKCTCPVYEKILCVNI